MAKKEKIEKEDNKNGRKERDKKKDYLLTSRTKRWLKATLMFLITVIVALSFFNRAGVIGQWLVIILKMILGDSRIAVASVIAILFVSGVVFLRSTKKVKALALALAILAVLIGISGISSNYNLNDEHIGAVGWLAVGLVSGFGFLVSNIIFAATILVGLFIFFQFIWQELPKEEKKLDPTKSSDAPTFKIKGIEPIPVDTKKPLQKPSVFKKPEDELKERKAIVTTSMSAISKGKYSLPPIDLLSKNETAPTSGNIKENSSIIKKTFENFGIPVEMAEVNVGPAVTQYAFKPAEGVKLSKITTLSNNLALALAAHPIRIEAPIPGKSLVGIEVPNKIRATVVLRTLVADVNYQNSESPLTLALGKDVAGVPTFTALDEQPHMLVAGATGTGKTIFLNSLIMSLLYKSTPEQLRLIMVDPKRVEFQNYNEIPHLLCPVINDAGKTINALQWLAREMERRFEVFSEIPTRNLKSYNANKTVIAAGKQLPYIVLIVDELADLMAAKGKELEAGIVRLAQMARATGIHLVLATQRPSVEVITGLIKANISSRISFQVASQIDSRTVIDTSGAEKLIGMGDMLFLSSKSSKLTRVQGPYVSENEVKRVTDWITDMGKKVQEPQADLVENLKAQLEQAASGAGPGSAGGEDVFFGDDDPLFEDVKRIVLETKKASASFLQRRLRIGYSRAARLIDMLEDKGIVGPADGAKPREVYENSGSAAPVQAQLADLSGGNGRDESEEVPKKTADGWEKV
ncbi:DNA translocase FtsK [Candidatus Parcubacteria bacterium]|nr:DNA translocase FtsK [Candidatus Parcubacteria bacterium]